MSTETTTTTTTVPIVITGPAQVEGNPTAERGTQTQVAQPPDPPPQALPATGNEPWFILAAVTIMLAGFLLRWVSRT